jgi:hypothetical protein
MKFIKCDRLSQQVRSDIEELQLGNFIGDQIAGINFTIFKVRAKNRDIPTGNSRGYFFSCIF